MKTIRELANLERRVPLITGGADHLGRAMAEALAELGATIVLLDIDRASYEYEAKALSGRFDVPTLALTMDLADEAKLRRVPDTIVDQLDRLNIVVNNAALVGTSALTGSAVPFAEQASKTWRPALEVNLTAPFVLVQATGAVAQDVRSWRHRQGGSTHGIVGPTPSLYARTKMGSPCAYAASKAGLLHLTRWLAVNLTPEVRVNMISPGGLEHAQPSVFIERYSALTPLRRMASEEDFKGAIVYLASDLSACVTGHNLVVNGGWTTW